jgi:hypothetical protein
MNKYDEAQVRLKVGDLKGLTARRVSQLNSLLPPQWEVQQRMYGPHSAFAVFSGDRRVSPYRSLQQLKAWWVR